MKPILRIVKHVRTLLTCILLFLLVQLSEAINVEGQIHVRNGSAEGATIHTIMDGFRLDVFKVGERGIYKIVLEQNHKYELIFSVTGNYPQKIEIETLIPNTLPKSATDFPTILHDVNLYTEIEGINFTFVNKPVKRIYYNAELNDFISEQFIDDSQIESQLEKALFHSVILKKEKAFITNLTGFEIAEMKREYDRILKNASIVYGQNQDLVPFNTFSDSEVFLLNDNTSYSENENINELLKAMILTTELDKKHPEKFADLIRQGDTRLNEEKYIKALVSFNRALSISSNDHYAKRQSSYINELIQGYLKHEEYQNFLAYADNSFNELLFSKAAENYQKALVVKPNEDYPLNKLQAIDKILEKEYRAAEKSKGYKQTLKEAETMYHKQFYEKSLASYNHALNLQPGDSYSTQKIYEIETEINKLADRLMYDKLIASANKFYRKEKFPAAMKDYFAASEIIPDDQFVLIRINAIDEKLKLDENFADFVSAANEQFAAGEYRDSKNNFLEALKIKSTDKYSRNKIKEIENILAVQLAEERFNASLATSNHTLQKNEQNVLKALNNEMSELISTEDNPGELNGHAGNEIRQNESKHHPIVKIETMDKGIDSETDLNSIYEDYISKGDNLFDEKKYVDSRNWYFKALDVKHNDSYPKQQINNINQLINEMPKSPDDRDYLQFVDLADSTFRENQYALARGWYNRALSVKANEQYPKDRLKEIEDKIAERMADQSGQQFEEDIKKAADALKLKNYNVARFWYKKALELRPENVEVKNKLKEIGDTLKLSGQTTGIDLK